ncbi:hypothetical protein [Bradyrhizobium sp. SEMIA]|uniref:hypothetical protein n=1 Tax=Bradyrhizobium sp. SEMIA TaxID=2597515 RepID=UPI0018A3A07D|nr:hypothetical protein [Bradyrhizobium sp. SEMIA]QOG23391.1 hypothetical protein FOM02_45285 [Bradyrhizobium sp. SEMIA]
MNQSIGVGIIGYVAVPAMQQCFTSRSNALPPTRLTAPLLRVLLVVVGDAGLPFPLPFDDPDLAGVTVGEVLAKPDQFLSKTLSDPFEGPDYGRGKAILYRREDGSLFISSFAHGGCCYELIELRREFCRLHAYAQVHILADARTVAGLKRQCASSAGQNLRLRQAGVGKQMVGPESAGRTDDMGSGRADAS